MVYILARTHADAWAGALLHGLPEHAYLYVAEPFNLKKMRFDREKDTILVVDTWYEMRTSQELRRKHAIYKWFEKQLNMPWHDIAIRWVRNA